MSLFDALPTMAEMNAKPRACPKGETRLDAKKAASKADAKAEARFLQIVRARDKLRCRCCARAVVVTLTLCQERAEVHHLHGRLGQFRFDDRFALLLCGQCHQRVTGKVNDRLFIVQKARDMYTGSEGRSLIDARRPVQFKEAK